MCRRFLTNPVIEDAVVELEGEAAIGRAEEGAADDGGALADGQADGLQA